MGGIDEMDGNVEAVEQKGMTRRSFLGAAAVAGAAAGLMSAGPVSSAFAMSAPEIAWDYETDVLVVGTGPAGMACAATAAEKGVKVIAIDANDKIGGKGILAGGNLGIGGGTRLQKAKGYVEDATIIYEDRTVEAFRTDGQMMTVGDVEGGTHKVGQWRKISGAVDFEPLSRVFADRSLDTWDWLDSLGCPFLQANVSAMANVYRGSRYYTTTKASPVDRNNPTGMNAGGAGLIWPMYDEAVKYGAQFLLGYKMTKIIREGERSGRVVGIEAKTSDGKVVYFRARKGVFLGTGSWNGSKNLKQLFLPWLSKYPHVSGEPYVFNDGYGIEAAIEAGASMSTDRGSDWHGWHRHPGTRWHSISAPYGHPGTAEPLDTECMYVNADGKRFMNEQIGEDNPAWVGGNPPFYFAQLCATQKTDDDGPIVWIILDETSRAKQNLVFTPGTDPATATVQPDMYATASTIADLAAKINVPAANLTAAVDRYNTLQAAGKDDDFGKTEMAAPIQTAPFHAVKWGIQKHNTLGGVTINEKAQVMDWSSEVIPGFYAAGESAGGMDLIGLAKPIVFGRVAGEWVAKETISGLAPTTISVKSDHSSILHGKSVLLSSHLKGADGIPAGAKVRFEVKAPGKRSYALLATRGANDEGVASLKCKLAKKGTYSFRARFLKTEDFAASTSKVIKVVAR